MRIQLMKQGNPCWQRKEQHQWLGRKDQRSHPSRLDRLQVHICQHISQVYLRMKHCTWRLGLDISHRCISQLGRNLIEQWRIQLIRGRQWRASFLDRQLIDYQLIISQPIQKLKTENPKIYLFYKFITKILKVSQLVIQTYNQFNFLVVKQLQGQRYQQILLKTIKEQEYGIKNKILDIQLYQNIKIISLQSFLYIQKILLPLNYTSIFKIEYKNKQNYHIIMRINKRKSTYVRTQLRTQYFIKWSQSVVISMSTKETNNIQQIIKQNNQV